MGFRFSKRINLGKGLGINISTSGINPSLRTKFGSISSKGFSANAGNGMGYKKRFQNSGCLVFLVLSIIAYQFFNLI
ncbi:hypothetical protein SAMN04487935_2206 [Flavobacterium noncentrifugens]|uniref:DUF4236 domain-containing protein n=1 Tax=Flavobacterium noncentrifugens TaxID=1128970 RepID=A0A1G8Y671_9FLAO|nr:hypothetical protein SAMN04487935_2206 [Flavobacterium noncentrifugens]